MARNRVLALLIVVATAAFAIGVTTEKSDGESGEPHVGAAESDADEAAPEPSDSSETNHVVLGIDAESTPLVVAAVIASLALAAAVWLRPDLPPLLTLVAAAMLAFAALDIGEVFQQADESNGGLAVLAAAVAALHLSAAALAFGGARPKIA